MFALIYSLVNPLLINDSIPDIFNSMLLSIDNSLIKNPSLRCNFNC